MICVLCGDTGLIRIADVYKPIGGEAVIDWNLSHVIDCSCTELKVNA